MTTSAEQLVLVVERNGFVLEARMTTAAEREKTERAMLLDYPPIQDVVGASVSAVRVATDAEAEHFFKHRTKT